MSFDRPLAATGGDLRRARPQLLEEGPDPLFAPGKVVGSLDSALQQGHVPSVLPQSGDAALKCGRILRAGAGTRPGKPWSEKEERSMHRKLSLLVLALAAALGLTAVAGAGTGGSTTLPLVQKGKIGTPRFSSGTSTSPKGTTNTIPYWSSSFTDPTNHVTYPFTMVGTNPATSPTTTTVANEIIPLRVVYSNPFTISSDGTSRVAAVLNSPVYQSSHYVVSNDS